MFTAPGCDLLPTDIGLDPLSGLPGFAAPTRYTVRRGDTLAKIASRHGVTVAELKSWNGLSSDLIEVDQVLVIWAGKQASGTAARRPVSKGARVAARPGADAIPMVTVTEVDATDRVVIQTPAPVGVLGVEIGGTDMEDLARSAKGLTKHDSTSADGSGLGERSGGLGSEGSAESVDLPGPLAKPRNDGPAIGAGAVSAPTLPMPPAKRCLPPPTDVEGEAAMATNLGLSVAQINGGMNPISGHAVACFPDGTSGVHEVTVEMVVGCDGRVSSSSVIAHAGLPAAVVGCLEQTLGHGGFPAHAVPDGIVFHSPLRFTF